MMRCDITGKTLSLIEAMPSPITTQASSIGGVVAQGLDHRAIDVENNKGIYIQFEIVLPVMSKTLLAQNKKIDNKQPWETS